MITDKQFKLPESKMCVVVWYRNGQKNEILINTPTSNKGLQLIMFNHGVGFSEIRAVKAVNGACLIGQSL